MNVQRTKRATGKTFFLRDALRDLLKQEILLAASRTPYDDVLNMLDLAKGPIQSMEELLQSGQMPSTTMKRITVTIRPLSIPCTYQSNHTVDEQQATSQMSEIVKKMAIHESHRKLFHTGGEYPRMFTTLARVGTDALQIQPPLLTAHRHTASTQHRHKVEVNVI